MGGTACACYDNAQPSFTSRLCPFHQGVRRTVGADDALIDFDTELFQCLNGGRHHLQI